MGEAIWVNINFRVPATWPASRYVPYGWDIYDSQIVDGVNHVQFSGEGNYGLEDDEIQNLLELLREQRVPFVATQDPKYEYSGVIGVFDGFTEVTGTCDSDGATLSEARFRSIAGGSDKTFLSVHSYFRLLNVDIEQLPIDHLQSWPPPDPDDALSFDEVEDAGLDGTLRDM